MKKLIVVVIFLLMIIGLGLYLNAKPVRCSDCNQGKKCNTSYDCGEIGVCFCQFNWEEEQEENGGIPDYGTCYFE